MLATIYLEMHLEPSKKATILFPPELHRRLSRLASSRGVSLSELVRTTCEEHYGLGRTAGRRDAVDSLAALALPIASPRIMKCESVPVGGREPVTE